jgi:hypothetical protein
MQLHRYDIALTMADTLTDLLHSGDCGASIEIVATADISKLAQPRDRYASFGCTRPIHPIPCRTSVRSLSSDSPAYRSQTARVN